MKVKELIKKLQTYGDPETEVSVIHDNRKLSVNDVSIYNTVENKERKGITRIFVEIDETERIKEKRIREVVDSFDFVTVKNVMIFLGRTFPEEWDDIIEGLKGVATDLFYKAWDECVENLHDGDLYNPCWFEEMGLVAEVTAFDNIYTLRLFYSCTEAYHYGNRSDDKVV